jgi:hypothetical protein
MFKLLAKTCLTLVAFSVPSFAGSVETFKVGAWSGEAFVSDQDGSFLSCIATANYRNGISMSIQIDKTYGWVLGFGSPQWNLTPGHTFTMQYRIDRSAWFSATATTSTPKLVTMPMPYDPSMISRFRRGNKLYVYDGSYTYDFRLTGTSRVVSRLSKCVDLHAARSNAAQGLGANNAQNQPADSQPSPSVSAPTAAAPELAETTITNDNDPALQLEATQKMFALIGYAGLSDIKLIPSDQLEEDLTGYHAVAEGNARLLVTHIVSNSAAMSENQLIESSITAEEKKCEGDFESSSGRKTSGGTKIHIGEIRCIEGDFELHERYVIAPRGKGGYYFIGTRDEYMGEGGGAPRSPADKLDDKAFQSAAINASK